MKKITIGDFLSGTFPLRNHFDHFLSDHDRSADCYWLRLDVFIATGIMWFTREGRKIIVAFPFPNRSGPPLSEDLQVRRNGIHAERCEWNTCNEPERGTDFNSRRLSPWTEST
ncbi:hypothetical protein TSUD_291910 [Trifolium subterraneum]|uniref:Uncharacterized protein n=1 Tax=Trifolium subterraneum TaxID=3900 RepID=A0A2Z6PFQ4_TRISU|nr:hypothetical protein TSUD_291910 [Trifolium subterraneum]